MHEECENINKIRLACYMVKSETRIKLPVKECQLRRRWNVKKAGRKVGINVQYWKESAWLEEIGLAGGSQYIETFN